MDPLTNVKINSHLMNLNIGLIATTQVTIDTTISSKTLSH
jgi:hypothetical protein